MKALLALPALASLAGGLTTASPAKAQTQPYRYCMIGTPNLHMDCTFSTLQQCQMTASAGVGFCQENSAYIAQARQVAPHAPRR